MAQRIVFTNINAEITNIINIADDGTISGADADDQLIIDDFLQNSEETGETAADFIRYFANWTNGQSSWSHIEDAA